MILLLEAIDDQMLNHCVMLTTCVLLVSPLQTCNSYSMFVILFLLSTRYRIMGQSHILTVFKPNSIKFERPCFYLGEMIIPKISQCKYLGVIISDHNCHLDLKIQMRKFYTNANMLIRKFFNCSVDVKCHVFKTYCSTLYCSAMWFNNTKSAMKKLKVAYNNSLRRLLSLPTYNNASEMFV